MEARPEGGLGSNPNTEETHSLLFATQYQYLANLRGGRVPATIHTIRSPTYEPGVTFTKDFRSWVKSLDVNNSPDQYN
jgi:hypothetical protein